MFASWCCGFESSFSQWQAQDHNINCLLLSSLTEEALSETLNATINQDVWTALHSTYAPRSKARELRLHDELQLMRHGSLSVSEYRNFAPFVISFLLLVHLLLMMIKFTGFFVVLAPFVQIFSWASLIRYPCLYLMIFFVRLRLERHAIFSGISFEEIVTPPLVAFHASN